MMTREQFMTRKNEIEERMGETRRKKSRECKDVYEMHQRQMHLLHEQYEEQRKRLNKECMDRCDEIRARYKKERQQLFLEDMELVAAWRNQLNQEGGGV